MPAVPHCTAQIVRSSSGPNRGLNQGRIEGSIKSPMPFLRTQVFCCFAVQWTGGTGRFHRLYGLGEGVSRAPGEQPFLEFSAVDSLSSLSHFVRPGTRSKSGASSHHPERAACTVPLTPELHGTPGSLAATPRTQSILTRGCYGPARGRRFAAT